TKKINEICIINRFYQELFKEIESFNIHKDFEFRAIYDTLHTRMIELKKINNSKYNGADTLTNEK
ncbi:7900_t:CDS:1, partial [Funneliformis geosporum]